MEKEKEEKEKEQRRKWKRGGAREGQHRLASMEGAFHDWKMHQLCRMYLNLRKHRSLPFTVLTSSSLKRCEKYVIT